MSRESKLAAAAAKTASATWSTHVRTCAACHPGTPASTCPTGLRYWRAKQDTAKASTAEKAADAAPIPGQQELF